MHYQKQRIIIATCLSLLGISSPAFSETQFWSVPVPQSFYFEGNYGASKVTNVSYPTPTNKNSGTGWNADLGYKFNPYIAVEGGYTRYAAVRLQNSQGTTAAHDNHYVIDVALRGMFLIPCTPVEVFGKIGANRNQENLGSINNAAAAVDGVTLAGKSSGSFGPYAGLGVDYTFTPYVQGNVQWAQAWGNNTTGNLSLISAGFTILFG